MSIRTYFRHEGSQYSVHYTQLEAYVGKFAPEKTHCLGSHWYQVDFNNNEQTRKEYLAGFETGIGGARYYKTHFKIEEGFVVPKDPEPYVMNPFGYWNLRDCPQFVVDLPGGTNIPHVTYLRRQRGEPTPPRSPTESEDSQASDEPLSGSNQEQGSDRGEAAPDQPPAKRAKPDGKDA